MTAAVVAGAGFGGGVAARVLSEHFDDVILVERDELAEEPGPRSGTPQAEHSHQVLTAARLELERLFPGFVDDAIAHTARYTCATRTQKIWGRLGWRPRYESDLFALGMSRHLIDWLVRQRVGEIKNVSILEGRRAVGLVADSAGTSAVGLRVADHKDLVKELRADLVVDATGRTSQAGAWLEELGYPAPEEHWINAHWAYSSCFVQMPEDFAPDFEGIGGMPRGVSDDGPLKTRAGGVFRIDGDRRWILAATGVAKDQPPRNIDGVRDWLRGLGVRDVTDIVERATFLTAPQVWRSTANRIRRFETVASRPEGFVAIGDSVATLNPVYGQGLSLATFAARDLGAELQRQREIEPNGSQRGLAGRFQSRLADSLVLPWTLSVRADAVVAGATSNFRVDAAGDVEYLRRLEALAMLDSDIALRFTETAHLVRSPAWIDDPDLRERVKADWDKLGAFVPGIVD